MQDAIQSSHGARDGPAHALAERRVLPRLPADLRPPRDEPDRRRGPDPLAAPRRVASSNPIDFIPLLEETGLIVEVGSVGARGGLSPGREVARGRTSDRHGRQRLRRSSSTPTSSSPTSATRSQQRARFGRADSRDHRDDAHAQRRGDRPAADSDQGPRCAHRDRRLRNRLLLARPPPAVPGRRSEDRPFVHLPARRRTPKARRLIHTLVQLGKALSIETLAEGIEEPAGAVRSCRASNATAARDTCSPGRSTRMPSEPSCRPGPRPRPRAPLALRAPAVTRLSRRAQ